ncbi:usg protein [Kaustia mangrovi]
MTETVTTESDMSRQLQGYSLTTAEILYHMPDHPGLLQSFLWQNYDLAPRFPRLIGFLDFWAHNLDGTLAQVCVAHRELVSPAQMRLVGSEWRLN